MNKKKLWTVWVGGIEVNDYHFTNKESAEKLADEYRNDDYDDVVIEQLKVKTDI